MRIGSLGLIALGAGLFSASASSAQAPQNYPPPPPPPAAQYQQPQQYQQPAPQQYQQPAPQPQYQQPAPQPAPPVQYQQPAPPPQYQQPAAQYPQPAYAPVGYPDAQGPIPQGAFQLGLGTSVVSFEPQTIEFENNGGKAEISSLNWGFAKNPVFLELGYGLSSQLIIGGIVGLGGTSRTQEIMNQPDQEGSNFTFLLGPKFDFMFSPNSKVRPFVGAVAQIAIDTQDTGAEASQTYFSFLARVGLRAFLADQFSIDPALFLGGGIGSGSQELPATNGQTVDVDFDISGFQIGLNVTVSGWLR